MNDNFIFFTKSNIKMHTKNISNYLNAKINPVVNLLMLTATEYTRSHW